MIHVRHAAAAIAAGLCETVLITHGERGPLPTSGAPAMSSHRRASPTLFTIPVLGYMKTYGLSHEQSRWLMAAVR
jgi:hypothetical protein